MKFTIITHLKRELSPFNYLLFFLLSSFSFSCFLNILRLFLVFYNRIWSLEIPNLYPANPPFSTTNTHFLPSSSSTPLSNRKPLPQHVHKTRSVSPNLVATSKYVPQCSSHNWLTRISGSSDLRLCPSKGVLDAPLAPFASHLFFVLLAGACDGNLDLVSLLVRPFQW